MPRDVTVIDWGRFLTAWGNRSWLSVPALSLLLLAPTLLYGQPFVFWDTAFYYEYGAKMSSFVGKKIGGQPKSSSLTEPVGASNPASPAETEAERIGIAVYGARSPFYSAWLYALVEVAGIWAAAVTQAAVIAWLIWRMAAQAVATNRLAWAAAVTALATLGGGAWFVVGFLMPDVYAAVALAAVALLVAYADRMSLFERLGIAALLAVSLTFHSTHLVSAVVVCPVAVLVAYLLGAKAPHLRQAMLPAVAALALAVALLLAFDAAARTALGASLKRPPFVMARIIVDGPGRQYLADTCPQSETFAVCAYRDRAFTTVEHFLWTPSPDVGVFSTLPLKERLRLIDEELSFVAAVVMRYPLGVLGAAVSNAATQFALVWPSDAWVDPGRVFKDPPWRDEPLLEAAPFIAACIAQLGSCVPSIPERLVFAVCIVTVLAALATIAAHAIAAGRARPAGDHEEDGPHRRAVIFALAIVLGLVVNAVLCGAISGPNARFQARVAWLSVVAALMLEAARPIVICRFGLYAGRLCRRWRARPSGV